MSSNSDIGPTYEGGCHCGALRYRYRTRQEPSAWNVRTCECSFCRAHRGVAVSDPDGTVEFEEAVIGSLTRYRFGQRSADFLICSRCGVHIGVVMETGEGSYGIINANTLRPTPIEMAQPEQRNFSEELQEQRIARRKKSWSRARIAAAKEAS